MKILILKKDKIETFILPKKVFGNYQIFDCDNENNKRNLINVVADNENWLLKSNSDVKIIYNGEEKNESVLNLYNFYILKLANENYILFVTDVIEKSLLKLKVDNNNEYTIGKQNCDIIFNNSLLCDKHLLLQYSDNTWKVKDISNTNNLYVNGRKTLEKTLRYGDVIFLCGLKIIVMKDYVYLNQIFNAISYNNRFELLDNNLNELVLDEYDEDNNIKPLYEKEEYFFKSPRFKTIIEEEKMSIDAPPSKIEEKQIPVIYTVGPMITMSLTSVVFAISSINNMVNTNKSIWSVVPTVVMAVAMLCSCILWPSLIKRYEKKQRIKREKERQEKYRKYINEKKEKINSLMQIQSQILKDNYLTAEECEAIILNKKGNLWNRKINDDDFLSLRVGTGKFPLDISINYREEDFMMEEDDLKLMAMELVNETRDLENVPISFSFSNKYVSGIVGNEEIIRKFLYYIILQIITFYSYDAIKIVFMTNENHEYIYDCFKTLPHIFSNDKEFRFFGTNINENKEISLYLERIFQERISSNFYKNSEKAYKELSPYYIIISDDYESIRGLEIIKDILESKNNAGFSLIMLDDKIFDFPNECEDFINVGTDISGIFASEVSADNKHEFKANFINNVNIEKCLKMLANCPLELVNEESNLPKTLGFLEMFNVGMIEQLNIESRYKKNNSVSNLSTPVGIDKFGDILYLDLHEKSHGPHGLIAGMTGSGKSEFIITYILSMAVNYSPDDVSFVLIDYKGGGLAGAFYNKETNIKLPHLAGTITNLDIADMNRALASIESELRRRQNIFNIARDKYGESTIDIYKYQTLFKEGKVEEAIPHLIIICDEFAELKVQQPDFMDQLISTARIGRSLGVHLILATQKPSGVVNDQIWSNSKFRVCLKVQESQDSMEMIKTPDAAGIKNVGRFYLQVGYNELFTLGQSAWCGTKYLPQEKMKKKVDTSLNFIDNIGNIIRSADKNKTILEDYGEELPNILNYIIKSCNGKETKNLWLEKIPNVIFHNDLIKKYNYKSEMYHLNPIIGEYDNPSNQSQGLLTLPLYNSNNTIIYGSAGSGKELLISSILYSLVTNHSPEEINAYIMDFGTDFLKVFQNAPHVGDIVSSFDNEKIDKLLQMLEKEMLVRKEMFAKYAGDYNVFLKNNETKLPMILLVINNYDNFIELYEEYFERLSSIIREGTKYGIITIMSAIGPNSVRYRLRQNFKYELCLQLSDSNEYYNIFGRFDKIELSEYKGRGLVKLDNVYEFQTAYPFDENTISEDLIKTCEELNNTYKIKASNIAILPNIVDINYLQKYIHDIRKVPVGVNKNTLDIEYFDFIGKGVNLITGQDVENMTNVLNGLIEVFKYISNTEVIVINANFSNYKAQDNIKIIESLHKKMFDLFTNNCICFILGLGRLIEGIDSSTKEKLIYLLSNAKKVNNFGFVLVDNYTKLKKFEYEEWYKSNVNNSNGLWIGNGISNQYTIMVNRITKEMREEISDNFGFVINNGKTILVKFIEKNKEELEIIDE